MTLLISLGTAIGCTDDSITPPRASGGPFSTIDVQSDDAGASSGDVAKDAPKTDAKTDGPASTSDVKDA
ncbi:MAG TPA: hypothetical protein VGL59_04190, partial [Polyangia bacterium]